MNQTPAVTASASSLLQTRRDSYRDEEDDEEEMTSYEVTSGLAEDIVLSYDANFNNAVASLTVDGTSKSPDSKEGLSTASSQGGGLAAGDNSSYGSRTLDSKDVDGKPSLVGL